MNHVYMQAMDHDTNLICPPVNTSTLTHHVQSPPKPSSRSALNVPTPPPAPVKEGSRESKANAVEAAAKDSGSQAAAPEYELTAKNIVTSCLNNCDFQLVDHLIKTITSLNDYDEQQADGSSDKTAFKSIHNSLSSAVGGAHLTAAPTSPKWSNTSNNFSSALEKPKNSNQQQSHPDKPNSSSQAHSQSNAPIKHLIDSTPNNQISTVGSSPKNSNHSQKASGDFAPNSQPLNNHSQGQHGGAAHTQRLAKNSLANSINNPVKDEQIVRLESDIKRLKADLQIARQLELDLHEKLTNEASKENDLRHRITRLQHDNENLQTKLHNLVTARQQDKQCINSLERKLQREKKSKTALEEQLAELTTDRQSSSYSNGPLQSSGEFSFLNHRTVYHSPIGSEYKSNGRRVSTSPTSSRVDPEECDSLLMQLKKQSQYSEDKFRIDDKEFQVSLRSFKSNRHHLIFICTQFTQTTRSPQESRDDTEMLLTALSSMQDKNSHLELSLASETKIKMDLFTALGETRRQLEMSQMLLQQRDKEVDELMGKLTELMAVLPPVSV
jgi:hypothetical protein